MSFVMLIAVLLLLTFGKEWDGSIPTAALLFLAMLWRLARKKKEPVQAD